MLAVRHVTAVDDARDFLRSMGIVGVGALFEDDALPRYAARRDGNHAEIRDGLRQCGFSVFDAGSVGGDLPDLICGAHGSTFLFEVKVPGGKVSDGQSRFAADWRGGPVHVVYSLEQALGHIARHARGLSIARAS